jgi:hypothetical protein
VPQQYGQQDSRVFHRVIEIDEIEETQLGNSEAVQVRDTAGNEFTTFLDDAKTMLLEEKERYVGQICEIGFTVYEGKYLSFHSIGSPEVDHDQKDVLTEEVDIEELVGKDAQISPTDRQITRQSAGHAASRIVQGMLEGGYIRRTRGGRDDMREEIEEELEYWTEFIKQHHQTGEWRTDTDA